MKFVLTLALLTCMNALMGATTIVSTDGKSLNLSQVEKLLSYKVLNGRINVIQIDNGGSTDISSYIAPSSLVVTYFADGEMNNVQAIFNLGNISKLVNLEVKGDKLVIKIEVRREDFIIVPQTLVVDISDLLNKAASPVITVSDFETQTLDATITIL